MHLRDARGDEQADTEVRFAVGRGAGRCHAGAQGREDLRRDDRAAVAHAQFDIVLIGFQLEHDVAARLTEVDRVVLELVEQLRDAQVAAVDFDAGFRPAVDQPVRCVFLL